MDQNVKMFDTPILFIIFNRPETEKRVFDVIRKIKPKELFVAADGPRKNKKEEAERCVEARKIIDNGVDWKCKIHKLYRSKNMGCKNAVSSAIDWFFKNVENGIIFEDDCLPSESFFNYCSILLKRYKNNNRIMHISGDNFQPKGIKEKNSYFFSRYPYAWGWATWRRAWIKYSVDIKNWRKLRSNEMFKGMSLVEKLYWSNNFDIVAKGMLDTWDYQWVYTVFNNEGYSIIPNVNLIENIGFGSEATHTKASVNLDFTRGNINSPLVHPRKIAIDIKKDFYTSRNFFKVNIVSVVYQYLNLEVKRLKKIFADSLKK